MSNIAHLDTTVLDTAAKFFRTMLKAGADFTGPMQNNAKRSNLVNFLALGCPKVDATGVVTNPSLPKGVDLARFILGDDFISPEDVAKAYGVTYTDEQLTYFVETIPDLETVLWLREKGYMLCAGPVADANLISVRALDRSLFNNRNDGWWENDRQTFSRTDVCKGGQWLMLKKGSVLNSRNKNWTRQLKLVTSPEFVPNVAEVSYGATVYRKVRRVNILPNFYVRTSSVDADGRHVYVGNQGVGSLGVYRGDCDRSHNYHVCVSSARN